MTLSQAELDAPPNQRSIDIWVPLRVSVAWLAGTFLLFLLVGQVAQVAHFWKLAGFVSATIFAFALGYRQRARRYLKVATPPLAVETPARISQIRLLTTFGGIYYGSYGVALLAEYGVSSPASIIAALRDPGGAYLSKFDVYASQTAFGTTNLAVQVLTLLAVFSAPLVPFLIVYWRHITAPGRAVAIGGLLLYVAYFLSVGTLSGLGQVLIFGGVAALVVRARSAHSTGKRRRSITALVALAAVIFVGYMAYAQAGRISAVGVSSKYKPNPIVQAIAGDSLARGAAVVAQYPTEGYQGLSYNLDTPFVWTKGRGSSIALDSYWAQYGLGESQYDKTYPSRTEGRTKWPAGQKWATIYPWLASDLTWFGAIFFMFGIGWWLARFWFEAVALGSRLSLLLLCQLGLLIAFVPANNQIGIGRPSLIAFLCLVLLYVIRHINERLGPRGLATRSRPV